MYKSKTHLINKNKLTTGVLINSDIKHYIKNLPNLKNLINIIKTIDKKHLLDYKKLEKIIEYFGINCTHIGKNFQPGIVSLIQSPVQFSKYLIELSKHKINSYLEIGVFNLGTFIITVEYLKRFNKHVVAYAVDIKKPKIFDDYYKLNTNIQFLNFDSKSTDFKEYIKNQKFDLCFIDGDHSESGMWNDYNICEPKSKILSFHDIVDNNQKDVCYVWNRIKAINPMCKTIEILDQYPLAIQDKKAWFGLGVLIK